MNEAREAGAGIFLEIAGRKKSAGPLVVPVKVKSLSAAGVVLMGAGEAGNLLAAVSGGEEAVIRLPLQDPDLAAVKGRLQWARVGDGAGSGFEAGMELADPDLRVRQALEAHLGAYPWDIKDLWDQWDRIHVLPAGVSAEQAVYCVGVGAMVGGSLLYLGGPESYKLFGTILAFYGCLMMGARSLWAMWQGRAATKNHYLLACPGRTRIPPGREGGGRPAGVADRPQMSRFFSYQPNRNN